MSRIGNADAANYLEAIASSDLSADVEEFTMGVWAKQNSAASSFNDIYIGTGQSGLSGNRHYIQHGNSNNLLGFAEYGPVSANSPNSILIEDVWELVAYRRKTDGVDGYIHEVFINGTWYPDPAATGVAQSHLKLTQNDVRLFQSMTGSNPAGAKLAHGFIVFEALSDTDVSSLEGGANITALTIADANKYAYYPMTDSSLANVWAEHSVLGDLVVNGTVANDDADNPTVDGITTPASAALDAPLQIGAAFSGTYSNFGGTPTSPIGSTDGTRTRDQSVTIGAGAFNGTWPALPASGASQPAGTHLFPGSEITLTITDPGA